MKKTWFFLLIIITACLIFTGDVQESKPQSSNGTTYYIRPDGGTALQCTGTTDAPYPGSGTNQPCAWSHPFWALDSSGNWKIKGGDTIIIAPGSYMMGFGAPNTSGWCDSSYSYDCVLPPLPPGPDADHPTRILGKGWDSGCPNPPELWGAQRPWQILDLTGSSNVYIGCLEITDHSGCVEFHASPSIECQRDSYPYGDWASEGILAVDANNVTLKHLNIHGLASVGIRAGRISNWTVEDVRVAGNGWVGWEGDLGEGGSSNSGTLNFTRFLVEWNGCGETYPGEEPHNCWAQTAGGYGDGLGTAATGGRWIFQDSIFRYNTSDGLDLLYVRNSGGKIDIKRTQAYGNAGNAVKTTGDTAIENCLLIGNCGYFNGKPFTYDVDDCRANGSTLVFSFKKANTISVVNSTIVGQGDCLITGECDEYSSCDGSETLIIKNNIFQGYADFLDAGDTTCYLWLDRFNFYNTQMDYNVVYDAKIADDVKLSSHDLKKDPLFVNDSLGTFDGHLKSGSPAIDSGLAVGSLNGRVPASDIEGKNRPAGSGVDRGAYEYGSSGGGDDGTKSKILVSRSKLIFAAAGTSATGPQSFLVSSSGTGALNWSVSADRSWLGVSPVSGSGSGNVTVSLKPSGLSPGSYTGTVSVTSAHASNSPQTVSITLRVYAAGGSVSPFGAFDTPADGASVRGSIAVTGWALDDIQVNSVKIYRGQGNNLVYIGDAVMVEGARPDVPLAYPGYPSNYKAGWGYMMLTNFLPGGGNGSVILHAIAADAEGNTVSLGSKTVVCDNAHAVKPFGAVDTPGQGGTVSGNAYINWGWVLTPRPNHIPSDGSTINVYVDGVNIGNPVYNIFRADIAGLFPDYANSSGAVGYFYLDAAAYENGVHTIQWTATDSAGNTDGIGSRYFTVQNTGNRNGAASVEIKPGQDIIELPDPVVIRRGYQRNDQLKPVYPGDNGKITVTIKEMERLEIHFFDAAGQGSILNIARRPAGSAIDRENGIFYWQPGPGFRGKHPLVFLRQGKNGEIARQTIIVSII